MSRITRMSMLRHTRPLWTNVSRAFCQNISSTTFRPTGKLTQSPFPAAPFTTSHSAGSAPGGSSDKYIVTSPWGSYPVPEDVTITNLLLNRFAQVPDKIALIDHGSGESLTYGQLRDNIQALSGSLCKHGVGQGDVVSLRSNNTLEMALLLLAIPATGACVSAMNPQLTKGVVERLLDKGPGDFLITQPEFLPNYTDRSAMFRKVFTIGKLPGYTSVRELIQEGDPAQMPHPNLNPMTDPALIVYTGGTTGLPKGVRLSHHNLVAAVTSSNVFETFNSSDVCVSAFQLSHIAGISCILMSALYASSTLVMFEKFDFVEYLKMNEKYKATMMYLPTPVGVRLLKDPTHTDKYDLGSVRKILSGTAPISAYVQEGLCKRLNLTTFRQIYGMSELAGLTCVDRKANIKFGSAGLPVSNMSTKIVDLVTGEDLLPTSTGELYVRGPQVMLGYLNNHKSTTEAMIADGWLKTGDVARHDADGSLFVIDRCEDLIKYNSHQVAPAELEGVLLGHLLVADVGVIGVPDDQAGEVPLAFIVLQQGAKNDSKTEKDIIEYVADKVASYKQLRGGIRFVTKIPKLPTSKINRRVLRQMAMVE